MVEDKEASQSSNSAADAGNLADSQPTSSMLENSVAPNFAVEEEAHSGIQVHKGALDHGVVAREGGPWVGDLGTGLGVDLGAAWEAKLAFCSRSYRCSGCGADRGGGSSVSQTPREWGEAGTAGGILAATIPWMLKAHHLKQTMNTCRKA